MGEKRGQVTIFIIIALLIVGIAVIIYLLIPKSTTTTEFNAQNPGVFLDTCLKDDVEDVVDLVSMQGGSVAPENYATFQGTDIEYLCYTNEYYRTCVVQQPLLKQHIESEIKDEISEEVEACFNALEENYRGEGYNVNLERGATRVELLPKRVVVGFDDYILTVSKGDTSRYDAFSVVLNNNLYELTGIANNIIDWETKYGDAETTSYMLYYKDLKVEKKEQTDGTTIYVLTDRNNDRTFQFASRSAVLPLGFAP